MSPTSIFPAIFALFIAFVVTHQLAKIFGRADENGRFASIDGLRGYLAFFVFIHHSSIWYFYLRSGTWTAPPSNLYTHFGESSVALFFMITSFLFFTKINQSDRKDVDWLKLFVSRVLRLVPMYFFAVGILFCIVAIVTHGELTTTLGGLFTGLIQWLSFTILGGPNLNNMMNTWIIIAGVTWSLPYEWLFYLSLPLLAIFTRAVFSLRYAIIGAIFILLIMLFWRPVAIHLLSFLGGIIASLLVKSTKWRDACKSPIASVMIIVLMITVIACFPSSRGVIQIIILSLVFSIIAGGNNLFGVLTHYVSTTLGEMAYSIYLMHGLLLFVCLQLIVGTKVARSLSSIEYWSIIVILTPILVGCSFLTFTLIEKPAMQNTNTITNWLRRKLGVPINKHI